MWSGDVSREWAFNLTAPVGGLPSTAVEAGYNPGSPRAAFYPLFPALLTPVSWLFGAKATFVWGLVLSNILSVVGFWILYCHFRAQSDHSTAACAIALMFAMPGAIYFSLIYTESLFLFLSAIVLRALAIERYHVAALASFFLPLTKAIGWFIVVALFIHWLSKRGGVRLFGKLLAPPLMGYACYFLIMAIATGNPFEGFRAQDHYKNNPSIAQIFDLVGFLQAFGSVDALFDPSAGLVDRVCFLIFCIGLGHAWRFSRADFWWALSVGIIPALSNQFLSFTRFVSVIGPLFLGLGYIFQNGKQSAWGVSAVTIGLIALQVV